MTTPVSRRQFGQLFAFAIGAPLVMPPRAAAAPGDAWAVKANIAESCSCPVPCPCNFGMPTDKRCDGSRLIQMTKGHFGGVDLSGVSFVVTFYMGNWAKIYVDNRITDAQFAAFEKLLPAAFAGFHRQMRSLQRVPLQVSRTETVVKFSVPESAVEMEVMKGLNGKPITVDGLPSPMFVGYTQYRSIGHTHKSADAEFSYSKTNGFTSRTDAQSA
jgi:hypothetical protein